jgi:hypothetical protein
MLITFILTLFVFSLNEAISTYWFSQNPFAPMLVGLTEVVLGYYSGLSVPIAQSLIWGGGLSSIREGMRNYDQVKDKWKPVFIIGNFIAVFLIWRLAQNVVKEEVVENMATTTYCPTSKTIDLIGADQPMIVRLV